MKLSKSLFSGRWGLEREVLRVDSTGQLVATPHPFPPEHSSITVDFAEAQAELITGVHATPRAALEELANLQSQLEARIDGELLWPFSLPGQWGPEAGQPARFEGHPDWEAQREYRRVLRERHGSARQVLSGVHVNYSFGPEHPGGDYFSLARNFIRYRPLLTYVLAASPWLNEAYRSEMERHRSPQAVRKSEHCAPRTVSVRQGGLGYALPAELEQTIDMRFDSLDEYLTKLGAALKPRDRGPALLRHEREFYTAVRPKAGAVEKGQTLAGLARHGVQYLEFRSFDLDPFSPWGIHADTLAMLELLFLAATVRSSPRLTTQERDGLQALERELAECSGLPDAAVPAAVRRLWKSLKPTLASLADLGTPEHALALERWDDILSGQSPRLADRLSTVFRGTTPLTWGLERADLHRAWSGLELSTRLVIEEADRRGVRVTLLDASENFLLLERGGQKEYVEQATRTSADPYIAARIMESKAVTKRVLERAGLRVPQGGEYTRPEDFASAWWKFGGRAVVIKPNATNFGDGVAILEPQATEAAWRTAWDAAFTLDRKVLVEEFAVGKEFRFLVIGGETRAVLHRVPANVVGDGRATIRELVARKNEHPWRGEGYQKPLEKLRLDETERETLAEQGLSPESVPGEGQPVFLRHNSNISTGGDSLDFTDRMPAAYSRIAEQAAAAVGAQICGLDLILPDWTDASAAAYTILELNFNPALHIHAFPAEGKNRRPEAAVLDLLGFYGKRKVVSTPQWSDTRPQRSSSVNSLVDATGAPAFLVKV